MGYMRLVLLAWVFLVAMKVNRIVDRYGPVWTRVRGGRPNILQWLCIYLAVCEADAHGDRTSRPLYVFRLSHNL